MKLLKIILCSFFLLSLASCATTNGEFESGSKRAYQSSKSSSQHIYHAHKKKIDI